MIPIVSIGNSITFIVSAFITVYLWRAYIKKKEERLKYFLYFFISISLLFFFIATPFIVFKNVFFITFSIIATVSFLYLSLAFIIFVSLRILNWRKLEKAYLIFLILALIPSFLMIIINLAPVQISYIGNFVYWVIPPSRTFWKIGSLINGIVSGTTLLSVTIFFLVSGLKNKESFIRKRSYLMGSGMFFLTLAGVVNFIIGSIPNLIVHIIASLISVLGLLTLFAGIVIIKPEPRNV